jgi:hypothetical protein
MLYVILYNYCMCNKTIQSGKLRNKKRKDRWPYSLYLVASATILLVMGLLVSFISMFFALYNTPITKTLIVLWIVSGGLFSFSFILIGLEALFQRRYVKKQNIVIKDIKDKWPYSSHFNTVELILFMSAWIIGLVGLLLVNSKGTIYSTAIVLWVISSGLFFVLFVLLGVGKFYSAKYIKQQKELKAKTPQKDNIKEPKSEITNN